MTCLPSPRASLPRPWQVVVIALVLASRPALSQDLPAQQLLVYGGGGGSSFTRSCGTDKVMTGFQYRKGFWFDAIGVLCRPVQANGSLGAETAGSMAGGSGGQVGSRSCPVNTVVTGGSVEYGNYIETVRVYCRDWKPATRSFGTTETLVQVVGNNASLPIGRTRCENATQPVVSIRGRSASYVDALGFICNEP